MIWAVLAGILLVGLNAYFVGAEFSLVSAERTQVETRKDSRRKTMTLLAVENVSEMMAVAQLGITTCSVLLGAVAEPAIAAGLEGALEALALPEGARHPVALILALALVVSVHMVLGEMVPKNIAIAGPERTALVLGPSLYRLGRILHPVVRCLNASANWVLRRFRVEPVDAVDRQYDRSEMQELARSSRQEGELSEEGYRRLTRALGLEERSIRHVLLPREKLHTLPLSATAAEVERACVTTGHSRYPLEQSGTISGYVHVKDVLHLAPEERIPLEEVRELPELDAAQTLQEALEEMRRSGAHLALVHDEGQEVGVVTLEDVLEELVGKIHDNSGRKGAQQ